jgi:DNA replication protein DnaC
MLTRPKHLSFSVTEWHQVILAPGESPDAVLKSWSANLRFCKKHPGTQLVSVKDGEFWPVYEDNRGDGEEAAAKPGEFNLRASFSCPVCGVAFARCPPEYHESSFDTFATSTPERTAALACARGFATQVNKHGCGFALFVGPPGTGKSRLACNIIRVLENHDALYVRHGELTAALRATYGRNNIEFNDDDGLSEPENPLQITQRVRFLVLDEIGCNPLAGDERHLLDELIKHRYDQCKPTILVSNLPLDRFKEFVGDALADRIRHAAGNGKFVVQFKGDSFRRITGESYLKGHG